MGTDEEVARELHRQINGSSRRQRNGSGDLTRFAARGRASLRGDSEIGDVNMSDADPQSPGNSLASALLPTDLAITC